MKIRSGFVSNSSSASFIVKFTSTYSFKQLGEFITKSNEWLAKRWNEETREKVDWKNLTKKNNKPKFIKCTPMRKEYLINTDEGWEIHPSTTMFNDWTDVPGWKFIRAMTENRIDGIKFDKIIKTEEEYDDCYKEVEFDVHTWSYEYLNNKDESEEEKKETLEKEEEIKYEYLSYLSMIGCTLTVEEENYLAKNYLCKL